MFSPIRVACLACALAAPASAQEAFTWHYDAQYPIDVSATALNLVATQPGFGPDTAEGRLPGGLIWARCLPNRVDGNVGLRFEAFPVAALAEDEYAFQLNDNAGTVLTLQGVLADRELNQPTGGLEVFVDYDGPEMGILAAAPVLTYGIVGFTDFQLSYDLSGNQDYVSRFAQDCGALTQTLETAPAVGAETAEAPSELGAPANDPEAGSEIALEPDLGPNITGHIWSRFTQVDETNVFNTIVQVRYAVPETDDVVVSGQCVIGAQNPYVVLQVAAEISGMVDGDPTVLRVSADNGRSVEIPGTVIGTQAEFGISGVELALDVSDPAWLVLAGANTLRMERVGSQGGFVLTGNGPNTLGPFLADCDEIDELTPESGGRPSTPIDAQAGYLSCENFGRVASRDTGVAQVVNFINASQGFRGLLWIDPQGVPHDIAALNPGEASAFTTDPGHVWMATDGPGNCVEMIQPQAGQVDYPLRAEFQ